MNYDHFGQPYYSSEELFELLYQDPKLDLSNFLVSDPNKFNNAVRVLFADIPLLSQHFDIPPNILNLDLISKFDQQNQESWFMPDAYKNLDIAEWVLAQCKTEAELQRVGHELLLFQERNLMNLLRFLKYLVDELRKNNVVWGVGRGSSVSSYVLYLIGIHKINSLYYDLPIEEFLK